MRGFKVFFKKEWLEQWRTKRTLIVLIVFFIIGLMGPLMALITPEILKSVATEGMVITLPEPSASDSYAQFFNNMGQMGLILFLLLFSTSLTKEYEQGTLLNLLTKGLTKQTALLAKYAIVFVLWSIGYLVAVAGHLFYTAYYFETAALVHVSLSLMMMWLFGVLLLTLLVTFGACFKQAYASLIGVGLFFGLLLVVGVFPVIDKYNPLHLATAGVDLILGNSTAIKREGIFVVTLLVMSASVVSGLQMIKRRS